MRRLQTIYMALAVQAIVVMKINILMVLAVL